MNEQLRQLKDAKLEKYRESGELGRFYAIKEELERKDRIKNDKLNTKRANTKMFSAVCIDTVARVLAKDEKSRGTYLMERNKEWKTEEEK